MVMSIFKESNSTKWSKINGSVRKLARGCSSLLSNARNQKVLSRLGRIPHLIHMLNNFSEVLLPNIIFKSFRQIFLPFVFPNEILQMILSLSKYDPLLVFNEEEIQNEAQFKEDFLVNLDRLNQTVTVLHSSFRLSLSSTVNKKLCKFEEELKILEYHLSVFSKIVCREDPFLEKYSESTLVSLVSTWHISGPGP